MAKRASQSRKAQTEYRGISTSPKKIASAKSRSRKSKVPLAALDSGHFAPRPPEITNPLVVPSPTAAVSQPVRESEASQLTRAWASFLDTSLTPAERRAILAQASGAPLTQAACAGAQALASLIPKGAPEAIAQELSTLLYPGGQLRADVRSAWFAPFLPSNPTRLEPALEEIQRALNRPEIKEQIDQAMNVLRVLGRLEADQLSAVALDPSAWRKQPELGRALGVGLVRSVLKSWGIHRDISDLVVSAAALWSVGQSLDGPANSQAELAAAWKNFQNACSTLSHNVDVSAVSFRDPRTWDLRHQTLIQEVEALLATARAQPRPPLSPESEAAIRRLAIDASSVMRYATSLAKLAGAVANDQMDDVSRSELIFQSIVGADTVFIKILQKLVDKRDLILPLLERYAGGAKDVELVMAAIKRVQDQVPPVPRSIAEPLIRRDFEKVAGTSIEAAFSKFDWTPWRAASTGVVYRAELADLSLGPKEVVFKWLRPNLEEQLDNTGRTLSMTIDFLHELAKAAPQFTDQQRTDALKLTGAVSESLDGFIDMFRMELDCRNEARALQSFAEEFESFQGVQVPQVIPSMVGQSFVVMEKIDGTGLSTVVDRRLSANQTAKALWPERSGSPPDISLNSPADRVVVTEANALDLLKQRLALYFGLPVDDIELSLRPGYFRFTAQHPGLKTGPVSGLFTADGRLQLENEEQLPLVTDQRLARLRDLYLLPFVVSPLVDKHGHGDFHEGNSMVRWNFNEMVMLDWGNVFQLAPGDLRTVAKVARGLLGNHLEKLSEGVVGLSTAAERASPEQKREWATQVARHLQPALEKIRSNPQADKRAMGDALVAAAAKSGLDIAPRFLQVMATAVPASGHIERLQEVGAGKPKGGTLRRITAATLGRLFSKSFWK